MALYAMTFEEGFQNIRTREYFWLDDREGLSCPGVILKRTKTKIHFILFTTEFSQYPFEFCIRKRKKTECPNPERNGLAGFGTQECSEEQVIKYLEEQRKDLQKIEEKEKRAFARAKAKRQRFQENTRRIFENPRLALKLSQNFFE